MPQVLNKKRSGQEYGWPLGPHGQVRMREAVYCGRGSPYGNPYIIGKHGDRQEVCRLYRENILPTVDCSALKGKDLVCWCAPLQCHCDDLLIKANDSPENPIRTQKD